MEKELTKNADKIICTVYKAYLERIKEGMSRGDAVSFDEFRLIKNGVFSGVSEDDAECGLEELARAGLIKLHIDGTFEIETTGIIYMERRFQDGLTGVLEWLAKIKDAIPFA